MDYTIEEIETNGDLGEAISAPNEIIFFPENYNLTKNKSDFVFPDELADLKKVFAQNGTAFSVLGGQSEKLRSRKYADWVGPAVFFSLPLITENPTIVSISLNVISNYVTDFFKGIAGEKRAKLEIYVEQKGKKKYKRINYSGPPEGIKDLEKVIKSLE